MLTPTRPDAWEVPARLRIAAALPRLCRRHQRLLWGQPHMVTPRLVPTVFGDGLQLIGLTPAATRPDYFIVRIDSSWSLDTWASEGELFADHLDEIYDAIEDAWGTVEDAGLRARERWFPRLDLSCGVSWFSLMEEV